MDIKCRYLDCLEALNVLRGKITDAMVRFDIGNDGLQHCVLEINDFSPDKLLLFEGDFPDMMFYRLDDYMMREGFYKEYKESPDPKFSGFPMCHAKNYVLSATTGFWDQPIEPYFSTILTEFSNLDWLYRYAPDKPDIISSKKRAFLDADLEKIIKKVDKKYGF